MVTFFKLIFKKEGFALDNGSVLLTKGDPFISFVSDGLASNGSL